MNLEHEIKVLKERLEKSNKPMVAGVYEAWRVRRVFPVIKESFPEAQIHKCAGLIYLTVNKEQRETLQKHLQNRKQKLEAMQKSGKYDFGEDKETVAKKIQELIEVLEQIGEKHE